MSERSTADISTSTFVDLSLSKNKKTRLQKLVTQIVQAHNPEYIYLFGSYARNEAHRNSAFDLLIIGKTELKFLRRITSVLKLGRGLLTISPLFYTPQEWEVLKKNNDGFMATIMEEAKLLYHRS